MLTLKPSVPTTSSLGIPWSPHPRQVYLGHVEIDFSCSLSTSCDVYFTNRYSQQKTIQPNIQMVSKIRLINTKSMQMNIAYPFGNQFFVSLNNIKNREIIQKKSRKKIIKRTQCPSPLCPPPPISRMRNDSKAALVCICQ